MKKSTKLFALVLTLALVLGVFTVGALAATDYDNAANVVDLATGEKILIYSDFSNAEASEYTGTASIPTNNGSTLEMKLAEDDDANPGTGVALAVIPALVAAAAVVVSKKRS